MSLFKRIGVALLVALLPLQNAMATTSTYTPLVSDSTFSGIRTDVNATAVGVISLLVIVVAVGLIARTFTR